MIECLLKDYIATTSYDYTLTCPNFNCWCERSSEAGSNGEYIIQVSYGEEYRYHEEIVVEGIDLLAFVYGKVR